MSDVSPEDLTEEEQAVDPASNHPDDSMDDPESQEAG